MSAQTQSVVDETKAYYDGAANEIYRNIWGENIHIGYFLDPQESLHDAMHRSNEVQTRDLGLTPKDYVLDVGCGYGALARYLAKTYGSKVLATNISDKELDWGRELTAQEGLSDKVGFEWADFHELQYPDHHFTVYFSQEAFLHAADKTKVLEEAYRVLQPGGRMVFSDLLVRHGTPQSDRERIYERIKSPDMWDTSDYTGALAKVGFQVETHHDWSSNVALTYNWVRTQLENRRDEFEPKIGKEMVDRVSDQLGFWVQSGKAGKVGWEYFVCRRPHNA